MKIKIEYNEIAEEYARYRSSDAGAVERLIAGSAISKTSRVLEIGCGTGNYINEIQKRIGCQCTGIDSSLEMIAQASQRNSRINYFVGPAEYLSLEDSSFDFAFSIDVIHHVVNRAAYFREAFRMLNDNGLLATLTDLEDTIRRRKPLTHYFPEIIEHELKRYPTPDQLKHYSGQAGFKVICEEIVETPFELTDVEKYRKKAFSCLRLISEEAFAAGIERMERDLKNGPIPCVSRNFIIWNKKRKGNTRRQAK
jgi:ubiquinone/menaquinone biosynthesis C-methylase UbiE